MRMRSRNSLAVALLLVAAAAAAAQSVPQRIKVQGYLSDKSGGQPVAANGSFAMTFELYVAEAGGSPLAVVGPLNVTVTDGLYEVDLPLPTSVFGGSERYLQIVVAGEVLSPRVALASTPFAYMADKLDGFEGIELEESAEIVSAIAQHAGNPSAHHAPVVDTTCSGKACDLRDPAVAGCDPLAADAQGNLICGTGSGGAASPPREFCFDADDMKAWEDSFPALEALDGAFVDTSARAFDRQTVERASVRLKLPGDLDPGGVVGWRVLWLPRVAPATARNVVWGVDHLARSAGQVLDAAPAHVQIGIGSSGTVSGRLQQVIGATAVSTLLWQPDELVLLRLSRDSGSLQDTLDGSATAQDDDALLLLFCVEVPRQ